MFGSKTIDKYGELCLKAVLNIEGQFLVPRYQRGYRWGQQEVVQLVKDIRNNLSNYCLQPVVVKKIGDEWELVDGQQRLTTLFLLIRALGGQPRWTLRYETRPESTRFLAQPDAERARANIDFHHIWEAEQSIAIEIDGVAQDDRAAILEALGIGIRVIWYEAPAHIPSIDLFTRLNSGRIPLNDAELFKALLLSQTLLMEGMYTPGGKSFSELRANEVAVQWDMIERDLRRAEIWAFLAGNRTCVTHISLLLEIVAGITPDEAAGTFKVFDQLCKKAESGGASTIWRKVVQLHERMIGWYEDRVQYHRIGFLIAQAGADGRNKMLRSIEAHSAVLQHSSFNAWLLRQVSACLDIASSDLIGLRYKTDDVQIRRLLLLMNVETTAKNIEARYPFAAHHACSWDLEHIHAQNAQELNTAKQWSSWVKVHRESVLSLPDDTERGRVLQSIEKWLRMSETDVAVGDAFRAVSLEILVYLDGNDMDRSDDKVHGIGNLALLSKAFNIGLSNSAFEVKRRKIIEYDRNGDFIPACTRHVFLKYYSTADILQPHFWSAKDREAYLEEMKTTLSEYFRAEVGHERH